MLTFIIIILLLAVIGGVYTVIQNQKKQAKLKQEYDEALRGTDKARALAAGRAYYASIRPDRKLTMYDEQALTNDLNTMKNH